MMHIKEEQEVKISINSECVLGTRLHTQPHIHSFLSIIIPSLCGGEHLHLANFTPGNSNIHTLHPETPKSDY